jgi:hypothetical protein
MVSLDNKILVVIHIHAPHFTDTALMAELPEMGLEGGLCQFHSKGIAKILLFVYSGK